MTFLKTIIYNVFIFILSFIATKAARKSIIAAMALMVFGIKTYDLPH